MRFIGRERELSRLKEFQKKRCASLIVIRGRRRIGKSRLIEEFAKGFKRSFIFSGLPPESGVTAAKQQELFVRQMQQQQIPRMNTNDWSDLFLDLATHCQKGSVLLALDEITWMGSKDPTFLGKLKTAWDLHLKKNPQLVLVLSGSDSTWIERNILNATGFVGRISYRMKLKELPLNVCANFFSSGGAEISAYEIFKVLSVTGGVPRYLEEIQPQFTAEKNLLRLCFDAGGLLFNEFDQTFSSLFSHRCATYKQIVMALAQGAHSVQEVAEFLHRKPGGDLSRYLNDLWESGFVAKWQPWNLKNQKTKKAVYYRLCDNYTRFFLRYIDPIRYQIENDVHTELPIGWHSILGLQFESLIVNHARELHVFLNIDEREVVARGPYLQKKTSRQEGCQIDYLVQTKFDTLYLCEIKFSREAIGTKVISQVKEKVRRLSRPRGISIRPVLIHVNGVTDELLASAYFSHVVDFSQLLFR
jgi:AAA+ ATPase superfamily predicted ATPase